MQIVVLGLGRFGMELARTLASQGHEVLAVDQSEPEVQRLADEVAKAAIADITDEAALRELGVAAMDVGVVATAMVEASVLAVMNLPGAGCAGGLREGAGGTPRHHPATAGRAACGSAGERGRRALCALDPDAWRARTT